MTLIHLTPCEQILNSHLRSFLTHVEFFCLRKVYRKEV